MPEFWQTRMGTAFYEGAVPRIVKALETLVERSDPAANVARENAIIEELRRQLQAVHEQLHALERVGREHEKTATRHRLAAHATDTQATTCAVCLEHKHTPLRRDEMGGYVCLTCIDKRLDAVLPVDLPAPVRDVAKRRMPLDGADAQALEHALTITERERDKARQDYGECAVRARVAENARNMAMRRYREAAAAEEVLRVAVTAALETHGEAPSCWHAVRRALDESEYSTASLELLREHAERLVWARRLLVGLGRARGGLIAVCDDPAEAEQARQAALDETALPSPPAWLVGNATSDLDDARDFWQSGVVAEGAKYEQAERVDNARLMEVMFAPAGTGQACGAANDCQRFVGHDGPHMSRHGRVW